jgi:hypothetical protein
MTAVDEELQALGDQVANLSEVSDEDLEGINQTLMAFRASVESKVQDLQKQVQAETTRRADEARLAALADTLTEEERDALRAYLDSHPVIEAEVPVIDGESDLSAPDVEIGEEPAEG